MDRIRDAKQLVDGGEAEVHVDERPDGLKARLELGGGLSVTREENEVMVEFVETYNDFLADLYEASDGGERELDDGELADLVLSTTMDRRRSLRSTWRRSPHFIRGMGTIQQALDG